MKRFFCVLLALCLLGSVSPAAGSEREPEDRTLFNSRFGFSLWYPADVLSQWNEDWNGKTAEYFCPWEDHSGNAFLACLGSRFSMAQWDGYARLPLEGGAAAPDYPFEAAAFTDGEVVVEQWIVSVQKGDQVFIIQYEQGDPQGWGGLLRSLLETLEFPPQPAENSDFSLDFAQNGAAGARLTDVVYDEYADPITLTPFRDMRNFVLEALTWDDESFTVAQASPIYAASILSPGDNLNIYCYFSDVLPVLRVRYTDGDGNAQCLYFAQSGRDGSLLLLRENEAVF